jgi:hypothetical protein
LSGEAHNNGVTLTQQVIAKNGTISRFPFAAAAMEPAIHKFQERGRPAGVSIRAATRRLL